MLILDPCDLGAIVATVPTAARGDARRAIAVLLACAAVDMPIEPFARDIRRADYALRELCASIRDRCGGKLPIRAREATSILGRLLSHASACRGCRACAGLPVAIAANDNASARGAREECST